MNVIYERTIAMAMPPVQTQLVLLIVHAIMVSVVMDEIVQVRVIFFKVTLQ